MSGENLNTFSIYLENDYFAGKDGEYSSGLKLTWSSAIKDQYPQKVWPHRWFYPLIKHVPFEKYPDRKKNITIAFGQNIFTPEDIESEEVVIDERPYAGVSYLSVGFHSSLERQMDTIEVSLGLVGPSSYAEQIQKAVHKFFDDIEPQGWDNQLSNEPLLEIIYEHKKKITQSGIGSGFGYDLILNTGGGFGNALIYYNLGLAYRFGWNIPNDFGIFPIRTVSSFNGSLDDKDPRNSQQKKFGIQLFFSAEGRAVLRNIFLDGNTFTDSHSVDKKPIVGDFATGMNLCRGRAQLSFAFVFRSKEYETQKKAQKFGSINFSVSY
ncbi:MAG: lipid A deacylase LpxR family protein [Desulfobacteraceae bacterium]|nr:lipid A deacylase LpxR family protein [Desulfobacteraceae bacterium]MBC2757114.1 lipid A deacylase LpxR family protein [Desulfobacteraceae bacterium]